MPLLHTNRNPHGGELAGEYRYGDAGQAIIACLFFVSWITDNFFGYSTFLNQYIPSWVRIPVGIILIILASYLAVTGLYLVFGKKRAKPVVIREGAFRIIRHPIYLSEIILYLGLLTLSISLAALVIWIVGIVFLHYISRHEEKLLIARFGEEYKKYMRDVPMWIPLLRRK